MYFRGITLFFTCLTLLSCSHGSKDYSPLNNSALSTVENFYRDFLRKKPIRKEMIFSNSFQKLINLNEKLCAKKNNTIKCGWRVDGSPYLDAQEFAPNLTYKSSGIELRAPAVGTVIVLLNVFPGEGSYYDREITYKMLKENNLWVVDDILSQGESSRDYIKKENKRLKS